MLKRYYFFHFRFINKNNGVLFENDLLQIGVKSEYREDLGRLWVFYGNKTTFQLNAFCVDVSMPGPLAERILSTCTVCPYNKYIE